MKFKRDISKKAVESTAMLQLSVFEEEDNDKDGQSASASDEGGNKQNWEEGNRSEKGTRTNTYKLKLWREQETITNALEKMC